MQEGSTKREVLSSMSHLVDYAGRKSAHNAMLKDIVMLENQIPLLVLRIKFSSKEAADEMLIFMFIGLFKQTSPFKMIEEFPSIKVSESAHLLDFFYDMIVPKLETGNDDVTIDVEIQQEEEQDKGEDENSKGESSYAKQPFNEIWRILSKHIKGPMKSLKRVVSRPLNVLVKFPWKIISNLPGGKLVKQPIESLFFSKEKRDEEKQENENSSTDLINIKPPLIDEITNCCFWIPKLLYFGFPNSIFYRSCY